MTVTPYFELHIRPMFRAIDRDHMLFRLDLWDYDKVTALAPRIAEMLRKAPPAGMPTKAAGGPWPEGWIQVFESWIATGFQRLQMTAGVYSARRLTNGQILLSVSVQIQNGAADAWLDRVPSVPTQAEYVFYLRPAPAGTTEPARTEQFAEVLDSTIANVVVTDTAGRHDVTVTS